MLIDAMPTFPPCQPTHLFARAGEGLGRNRQGMSTPLMAQKTDRRSGVIVNAEPAGPFASKARPAGALEFGGEPADKRPKLGSALVGKPSRVICLRNMVSRAPMCARLQPYWYSNGPAPYLPAPNVEALGWW